jgi:hypothetical protein
VITIVCLGPVTIHLTATDESGSPEQNQLVTRLISNLQTGAALERAMATPSRPNELPATSQARPAAKADGYIRAPAATGHTCPICGKAISKHAVACNKHRDQTKHHARQQAQQDALVDAEMDAQLDADADAHAHDMRFVTETASKS